jgi:V8-like Glu-specific endopeptidase
MNSPSTFASDPITEFETLELEAPIEQGRTHGSENPPPATSRIQDRTSFSPKDKRKGVRDMKKVYALVLHQMAFSRGSHNNKYDSVTSHFAILPDGQILQLHPLNALLWASNGFNAGSVAVEFAGNFPNTKGKCWSAAKFGCHRVTPQQIESGRYLVDHLIRTMGLTHILAHRQSSGTRENDPGPDLWYHVGQWAVENRGLKDGGSGFKVGSGNPIPDVWRNWRRTGGTTPELETTENTEQAYETPDSELSLPRGQPEWSEEELQYSIIVSPTSPGDDRFRISARTQRPSTLMFPFNTICLLERHHLDGKTVSRVTGTLIAPQVVLTAKHCLTRLDVRTAAEGPRFNHIIVSPGADLSASRDQRPADPPSIVAPAAFFRVHPTLDYGVIILPKAFKRPIQFMRLQARGGANTATLLTIAGYPCDKPTGTMWGHSEKIALTGVSPTGLRYTIDTCPGHSGSPIWLLGNNAIRLLLGVHTTGPAGCTNDPKSGSCRPTGGAVTPVGGLNGGVRITCAVIDQINAWCREFRVTGPTVDSYSQLCKK